MQRIKIMFNFKHNTFELMKSSGIFGRMLHMSWHAVHQFFTMLLGDFMPLVVQKI